MRRNAERVNPFDWQRAFPQVFARGGFDAVIGNPPYVRPHKIEPGIKLIIYGNCFPHLSQNPIYIHALWKKE